MTPDKVVTSKVKDTNNGYGYGEHSTSDRIRLKFILFKPNRLGIY
jgi:hypothetical protein